MARANNCSRHRWFFLAGWFCVYTIPAPVAQEATTSPLNTLRSDINPQNADRFELDLSIPTSPAFTVLGVTPDNVVDPGNARDLAVELASFVEDGGLNPGLAVSLKPYWLGFRSITLKEYSEIDRAERMLARTQVSLATAESPVDGSDDVRVGIGVHTSLLDETDPRLDPELGQCIDAAYEQHVRPQTETALVSASNAALDRTRDRDVSDAERDGILNEEFNKLRPTISLATYNSAYERCQEDAANRFLLRRAWITGTGLAFAFGDGDIGDTDFDGLSFWTGYRWPVFGENGDLSLFGRTDIGQEVETADGRAAATTVLAAISTSFQSQSWKLGGAISYNYRTFDGDESDDDDFLRLSVTGSFKLRDDIWLEAGFGTVANADFDDEGFATIQLKIDFGREVLGNTPPPAN